MNNLNNFLKIHIKEKIYNNNKISKYYIEKQKHSKYSIDDILDGILYVLKTGISWRDCNSTVKWNSLFFHYKRFTDNNIFKSVYVSLKDKYSSKNKTNVQIIDSSFVPNKYGKNNIGRNKFYKSKNGNKISLISDIKGIPISVSFDKGNIHDLHFINDHIQDLQNINNSNSQITLLADKCYESKKLRETIKNNKYTLMIPKKSNMKINYFFDKILYKKRIRIEHTFQKLKIYRRISVRYDSLFEHYKSFVYLGLCLLISKELI